MLYLKAKRNFVTAVVVIFVLANMANAVSFEKVDLTSESDVLNDGTLMYAYNIGDTTDTTINGVTFIANDGSDLVGSAAVYSYDDGSPGSAIYNVVSGGITEFTELLNSVVYLDSSNVSNTTVTCNLNGLTAGNNYRVQLFAGDTRGLTHPVSVTVQGSIYPDLRTVGAGYNLIIEFTATAGTESVTLTELGESGAGSACIFGYVLHSVNNMVGITETDNSTVVYENIDITGYPFILTQQPSQPSVIEITATPSSDAIRLNSADAGQPVVITFTEQDWDTPQIITVAAVDDYIYTPDNDALISHTSTSVGDTAFDGVSIRDVVAVIRDDENCGSWGHNSMDLNRDCRVDLGDFAIIASLWLSTSAPVGIEDIHDLSANWLDCTIPDWAGCVDQRMQWWREGKFGTLITWGLYSGAEGYWNHTGDNTPAATGTYYSGIGEWIQKWASVPTSDYQRVLEPTLTATNFSAQQIAQMAKDAGMEYVVLMARHHDGYAMWDTQTTTSYDTDGFKVTNSPANSQGRDYIKEMIDAVRAEGLHVGIYYSLIDWHHPDFIRNGGLPHPQSGQSELPGLDWDRYVNYMHQQIRELVDPDTGTDYGQIDVLWFDYSSGDINGESWRATDLVNMIRQYQPQVIINNRLWNGILNTNGDFATPEQYIPPTGLPGVDWESVVTTNGTWGYKRDDNNWKSTIELIQMLVDTVSKGGNLLLNIGPTGDGSVPQGNSDAFTGIGDWMADNSESVKGTTTNPFSDLDSSLRCTQKPGKLYVHVFTWPGDLKISLPGLANEVVKAYLLTDLSQTGLAVTHQIVQGRKTVEISLPQNQTDPADTVVVVEIVGEPVITETNLLNVAQGKVASQSSTYQNSELNLHAGYAVDGSASTDGLTFSCTDGAVDASPWWQVDLEYECEILGVTMFNRDDCCQGRMRDLTVEILNAEQTVVYTSALLNPGNIDNGGGFSGPDFDISLSLDTPVAGQFVKIYRTALGNPGDPVSMTDDNNALALGEVEVYVDNQ